jgi:tripeptide aminopeptidase
VEDMISSHEVAEFFLTIVKINSPSFKEKNLGDFLTKFFSELGFTVKRDKASSQVKGNMDNLIVPLFKSELSEGHLKLILAAHLDTVEPTDGLKPVIEGGVIRSNGQTILGADDKAGVAALMALAKDMAEAGETDIPVYLVFTVAEEKGLMGAKALDVSELEADFAYTLDANGPVGRIVVKAPYHDTLVAKFFGRAAHAGVAPESGINAVKVAAEAISQMNIGRIDTETTANIGVIKGGSATNVVPDLCEVRGEARSHSPKKLKQQISHMIESCQAAASSIGAEVEITVNREYNGFNLDKSDPIVKLAAEALCKLGIEPIYQASGGGSDTNIFNQKGIPALNLSIGAEGVHTKEEFLKLSELTKLVKLLKEMVAIVKARGRSLLKD